MRMYSIGACILLKLQIKPKLIKSKLRCRTATSDAKKEWRKNVHLHSPSSNKNFDIQIANWRMESIVRESESGSDDEFFDCQGKTLLFHARTRSMPVII